VDKLHEIIEADQFKAVVMMAAIGTGFIAYVIIVNTV
jgi:hypothetical protein